MREMNSALVIGGAGFVGSHLCASLARRRCRTIAAVRPATRTDLLHSLAPAVTVMRVETQNHGALKALFDKTAPDTVFYVAGNGRVRKSSIFDDFSVHLDPAVFSLLAALRAAAEAKSPPQAFIRTGTLAEYGDAPTPHAENVRPQPTTVYAASVLAGSSILEVAERSLPFRIANARLGLVYGPRQSTDFLIPMMLQRFMRGEPVVINDPEAVRDLIHVSDVCDALISLAETASFVPGPVNIGSGEALSMRVAAEIILEELGGPQTLIRAGDPSLAIGSRRLILATEKMAALTGWRAKLDFRAGVRSLIAHAMDEERGDA